MTTISWNGIKVDGWNAEHKIVRGNRQVEIRRSFPRGGQLLVIIGLDGYNYGNSDTIAPVRPNRWHRSAAGYNVRISSNQAIDMTWLDWKELDSIIDLSKKSLENWAVMNDRKTKRS